MIPDHIKSRDAWQRGGDTHWINRVRFPVKATIGDTCMLLGTAIFLRVTPHRWARVGVWSPELARVIMHRVRYLDTGREVWRWCVEDKPKDPTEGCMEVCGA